MAPKSNKAEGQLVGFPFWARKTLALIMISYFICSDTDNCSNFKESLNGLWVFNIGDACQDSKTPKNKNQKMTHDLRKISEGTAYYRV